MADAITPTAATAAPTASSVGRTKLAENFETFLTLLTAQLKNQDPLSPMDSTQFTQQLVQMSGVEQQLQTNSLLEKLVGNTSNGISTAVSLIGKDVRATSNTAALANNKAEWSYSLDRAATDVKIEVLDAKGRVVKVAAPTDNKAGEHTFTWDGKGAEGSKLPDGVYSIRITAKDIDGKSVPGTTFVAGQVTGVEQVDGETLVTIRGTKVPWEQITRINAPAPEAADAEDNQDGKTSSPAAA